MLHLSSTSKNFGWFLLLGLLITPVLAHNVKVSKDVAATFHLEPNHSPQAGETAQVWFALTRQGGQIIPLQQCDCQLAVYWQPQSENTPLLQPPLKAVSVERYQGIPAANFVFPKAGAYQLKLSGTPKAGANFTPFELNFNVTVASRAATKTGAQVPSQPVVKGNQGKSVVLSTALITLSTLLGLGIFWLLRQQKVSG